MKISTQFEVRPGQFVHKYTSEPLETTQGLKKIISELADLTTRSNPRVTVHESNL